MRSSTEIQEDLTAALLARRTALQAQSYGMNDGQGSQNVSRANLSDINKTIRELQSELEEAEFCESGDTGLTSGIFRRY
jgi:hypothetical protein